MTYLEIPFGARNHQLFNLERGIKDEGFSRLPPGQIATSFVLQTPSEGLKVPETISISAKVSRCANLRHCRV